MTSDAWLRELKKHITILEFKLAMVDYKANIIMQLTDTWHDDMEVPWTYREAFQAIRKAALNIRMNLDVGSISQEDRDAHDSSD